MRILRKLLRGAAVLALSAAALAVSSCSGISERSDDSPSGAARVRLGGASVSSSRTLLSSFKEDDYIYQLTAAQKDGTTFVLKANGTTAEASSDNYNKLADFTESWSLVKGEWTFTLDAKNAENPGDVVLTGEKTLTLKADGVTQSLEFVMKALKGGNASLSVTLDFTKAPGKENVKSVKAFLTEKFLLEPADADTDGKVFTTNDGKVMFESDVDAGVTRYLTFFLFDGENTVIGYYSTAVFAFKDDSIEKTLTLEYLVPIEDLDEEDYAAEDAELYGNALHTVTLTEDAIGVQEATTVDSEVINGVWRTYFKSAPNGNRVAWLKEDAELTAAITEKAYVLTFDAALTQKSGDFFAVTTKEWPTANDKTSFLLDMEAKGNDSWEINGLNPDGTSFGAVTLEAGKFYHYTLKVTAGDSPMVLLTIKDAEDVDGNPVTDVYLDVKGSSYLAKSFCLSLSRASTGAEQLLKNIIVYECPTVNIPVTNVKISYDEDAGTKIGIGSALELTAPFTPFYATNKTLRWESSDETIATVDFDEETSVATVTGVAAGEATITVTAEGGVNVTDDLKISVTAENYPVVGVTLTPTTKKIGIGKTAKFKATFDPINASNKGVTWETTDETIATVDEDGVVTGVAEGTVTITATSAENSDIKATATVDVVLYAEDFDDVTDIATVAASPNASDCLSLATDNTNYLLFDNVQSGGSDRSMYLLNAFTELPEGKPYVIEFDAAVRGRHGKKRFSQLAILTGDEPKNNGKTANVVYTDNFLVSLTCGTSGGGSSGTWFINATEKEGDDFVEGTDGTVTLTNEARNHYKITVDGDTVKLVISGTDTLAEKTLTLPEHSGAAKWFYFNAAGYNTTGGGMLSLDNLIVTTCQ